MFARHPVMHPAADDQVELVTALRSVFMLPELARAAFNEIAVLCRSRCEWRRQLEFMGER